MSEKIENLYWNPLVPELNVIDIKKSMAFYLLCGFKIRFQREAPSFVYIELGKAQLMLEEGHDAMWLMDRLEKPFGRGINLQIEVSDVKSLCQTLLDNSFELFRPLKESWYQVGDKKESQLEFLIQDPDGYLLRFIEVLSN